MSLNAATAAPSGHFLVSRKKPSVIAQTHLISVSLFFEKLQAQRNHPLSKLAKMGKKTPDISPVTSSNPFYLQFSFMYSSEIYDRKKIKIFPFSISDLGTPSGIYKWDQKLSPAKYKTEGGVTHAQR